MIKFHSNFSLIIQVSSKIVMELQLKVPVMMRNSYLKNQGLASSIGWLFFVRKYLLLLNLHPIQGTTTMSLLLLSHGNISRVRKEVSSELHLYLQPFVTYMASRFLILSFDHFKNTVQ